MKNYLFDFDGTLVDSMPTYVSAMLRILDENKVGYGDDIVKIITPLGLKGTADYYITLGVKMSKEKMLEKMLEYMTEAYETTIEAKKCVIEALRTLYDRGDRLHVLTASPHLVTDVCLKRNGLYDLFEQVWSVDDFSLTKSDTRLFYEVADRLSCKPEEIHYFDDSLIALKNAKKAGYITYAVYDAQSPEEVACMKREYAVYVDSFASLLG